MHFNKILFGNRIYTARKQKGYKQIEISNALGISQSTYSKIENGKYDLTVGTLYKLSEILETDIAYLLDFNTLKLTEQELIKVHDYQKYILSKRKDHII